MTQWILTATQRAVMRCIESSVASRGYPPTRTEIMQMMGYKSPNAAETHLRAIEKKGWIIIERGTARGIRMVRDYDDPRIDQIAIAAELGVLA